LGNTKIGIDQLYALLAGLDGHIENLKETGETEASTSRRCERAESVITIATSVSGVEHMSLTEACAWKRQVVCSLVNHFCVIDEPLCALELCQTLLDHENEHSVLKHITTADSTDASDLCPFPFAYSRAFRICIQMGNLVDAERFHQIVKKFCCDVDNHPIVLIQEGLLLFSRKRYQAALEMFSNTAKLDLDFTLASSLLAAGIVFDDLIVAAANNMVVSALHCCEVRLGVNCVEALIQKDPSRFMSDSIIFNLCTLYDLAFNSGYSIRKKKMLQVLAKLYHLNTINPSSFRMTQ
jgi:hypothetical protein